MKKLFNLTTTFRKRERENKRMRENSFKSKIPFSHSPTPPFSLSFFLIPSCLVIILLNGCTQEYNLERMYYHANKKYTQIVKNPSQANPSQIDAVIADFNKISNTNPNWEGIKNVRFIIAHLYFLKNDFCKAREKFKNLISDFPSQINICLQARFFIGVSYEQEGKWNKALAIFEKIMADYPVSQIAIELPFYIAQYYHKHKEYEQADKILRNAITNYEKIINNYPYEKRLTIAMEDIILKTYEKLNDWDGMIATLEKIVHKHYNTERGAQSLYRLAKICESKNKVKKAIDRYNQFIKDYPDHKLVNTIKTKIHSLQLTMPKE